MHNQTDHILIDRRQYSCILTVQSSSRAECDIDHYLVVVKVREGLAMNKRAVKKRFTLNKLNEGER
jgi:hypothetical protein